MISLPLTPQKKDRPIPSFPFARISKRPFPSGAVYGLPSEGPSSSIISTICKKLAKMPAGKERVFRSTFLLKNATFHFVIKSYHF